MSLKRYLRLCSSGFGSSAAERPVSRRSLYAPLFLVVAIAAPLVAFLGPFSGSAFGQEQSQPEIAVNSAVGRVIICVAKDGIIVSTISGKGEAGSLPPIFFRMTPLRVGLMFGAVEWVLPASTDKPVRLDAELPKIAGAAGNITGRQSMDNAASDIESIGVGLLERVRELAGQFHHKVNLGDNDPLLRLMLVDYIPDYGPEVWSIDYFVRQDLLGNDIYRTRVLRPSYKQLYPPEKGQPHTFVESRFPPENRATQAEPDLIDRMRQGDDKLNAIWDSSKEVEKAIAFVVDGHSEKSKGDDDATFIRAAIPAIAPEGAKIAIGQIDFDKGFQWLVEPEGLPKVRPQPTQPQQQQQQDDAPPTLRQKRN